MSKLCVCKHKKTDHNRYQYNGGPSEYGQCNRCYEAYQRLPYIKKVKAVRAREALRGMIEFGIPIGCNKYE